MTDDLHATWRLIRARPGLCAAIVLTLAIGLGATTAIFTFVHALILRPLPFADPDRLILIEAIVDNDAGRLSLREYRDLERDSRGFESVAAYYRSQYNVTGSGPPEALTCTIGTASLFRVLGATALHGDVWPETQDFTRQYLVVLSHRLWQRRYGARPDLVGSSIIMDGVPYRVTGVLPEGFDYPIQTDVFRAVTDYHAQHVRRYSVVARLRSGVTLADGQAELDRFAVRFAETWPETNQGVRLVATPLADAYVGRARPLLFLALGAAGLLLVIACINVTNLLLSRAISLTGELAVRLALGATRRHLIRQSVTEALLLSAMGALLGVIGARWALRAIAGMVATHVPPWFRVELDGTVLLFAIAVTLTTAAVVGIVPALEASRANVERVLRQESGRTAGGSQQALRRALIAGQAAFAAVLLVATGVLVGELRERLRVHPGFDPRGVLTFRVDPPHSRYADIATTSEFYRRAVEQLGRLPGVEIAGTTTFLPFSGLDVASPRVAVEGQRTGRGDEEPFVNFQIVNHTYFDAMRIPLLRGRQFELFDTERTPGVAIVGERAAERFWSGTDPIGRRIRVVWNQDGSGTGGGSTLWLTVVGVVGNTRFTGLEDETGLDVYAPNTQAFAGDSYLVVRAWADPDRLGSSIRAALDEVDREQSFFDVQSLEARVQGSVWQQGVASAALAFFAAVALCLAGLGTYAVTSHAVASAQRELGVRLALGSSVSGIRWLIMRRWLAAVFSGTIVGIVAATALVWILASALDLEGTGLVRAASLPLLLIGIAVLACDLPVRRMLRRLSLAEVLRGE